MASSRSSIPCFCLAETGITIVLPPHSSGTSSCSASCCLTTSGCAVGLSILLRATRQRASLPRMSAAASLSPAPMPRAASITRTAVSTPLTACFATSTMARLMRYLGRCRPGVSMNTICPRAGILHAPTMRLRVVWGFLDVMEILTPRTVLSRVDLPALGAPRMATKPDLKVDFAGLRSVSFMMAPPRGAGAGPRRL